MNRTSWARMGWAPAVIFCVLPICCEGDARGQTLKVAPRANERETSAKPPMVREEEAVVIEGVAVALRESPKKEADTLVLEDGTELRFPPHLGAAILAAVNKGDKVKVEAQRRVTPEQEVHLHAKQITNLRTSAVVKAGPPARPSGDAPTASRQGELKKPDEPKRADGGKSPHEQILAELAEIRVMLEGRPTAKEEHHGAPHERVLAELWAVKQLVAQRTGNVPGSPPQFKTKGGDREDKGPKRKEEARKDKPAPRDR